ncbi:PAS domain-containing protein [Yoonia maricola]|uniref:PAS domain-containing protein n=1 Tax=Yoonia maricola TaxID=420999 RepID=A0A2M8W4N4_9RHOB|nr:PAS-domain containing protein [Yoonia maricola]PJI85891.1 PAS domain-containing protein [Yoonia maricola]
MLLNMAELLAICVAAVCGAAVIITLLQSKRPARPQGAATFNKASDKGTIFLFADDHLIDATPDAWAMIGHGANNLSDLDVMITHVTPEFPGIKEKLADPDAAAFRICSESDPTVFIDAKRTDNRLRISLNGDETWTRELAALRMSCDASNAETALMQSITTHSTQLVWHEDQNGHLRWANNAYIEALRELDVKSLFDATAEPLEPQKRRIAVKPADGEKDQWFDISTVIHAGGRLHFANNATEIVRADSARSEFVKTLGKTFGELSIGLAIFDKNRQVKMFNPAFSDMSGLPFDFLGASPTIDTVLDRLREIRMMPEPKNYTSWREQFTAVETAAKNGTYSKNWALPDGQTYRVTGRPHPDGAFALLFEDITAEVSLTRRFRRDIETGQAVLDTLSDAIAVFSATGTLVMSNRAYTTLWSNGPEKVLEHRILPSEMKVWQNHCIPSSMWHDMRDFIQQLGTRPPWSDTILMEDGRHLACHADPIASGMTLVRFAIAPPKRPEIRKLMMRDMAIEAGKR